MLILNNIESIYLKDNFITKIFSSQTNEDIFMLDTLEAKYIALATKEYLIKELKSNFPEVFASVAINTEIRCCSKAVINLKFRYRRKSLTSYKFSLKDPKHYLTVIGDVDKYVRSISKYDNLEVESTILRRNTVDLINNNEDVSNQSINIRMARVFNKTYCEKYQKEYSIIRNYLLFNHNLVFGENIGDVTFEGLAYVRRFIPTYSKQGKIVFDI